MKIIKLQLHNLMNIVVSGPETKVNKFLKEFSYYEVSEFKKEEVNIEIIIGDFEWKYLDGAKVVNKKYYVNNNSIYAIDSHKIARWKILIEGLNKEKTVIRISGNRFAFWVAPRWFCEAIVRLKLTMQGFAMIHSSCLSNGEYGRILAASPSTGKTTTLLKWLEKTNIFCSDEYTIFKNTEIYSYVTPFRLHSYNLLNKFLSSHISASDKIQIYLRSFILKITGGYGDVTWDKAMNEIFPDVKVVKKNKLKKYFILTRYNGEDVSLIERSREDICVISKVINSFEWRGFEGYLRAYSYVYPNSKIAKYSEIEIKNIADSLINVEVGEIRVPSKYNPKNTEKIMNILEK